MTLLGPQPTMPTGNADGPTKEMGYSALSPMRWSMWTADMDEDVPDLRWPTSVRVYHKMRTDSQITALLSAITLPIRRSRWVIDPNGARDEAVELVASALNLPIRGQEDRAPRGRRRFSHDDHLRQALLALAYGFMFFEQVGHIGGQLRWILDKLSPRMPQTISGIDSTPQGELVAIKQWPQPGDPPTGIPIPSTAIAPYVWDMEGSNWTGRSLLRSCYRSWLVKDRLIRVDAMKNERFGMGIPYGKAPPGASKEVIESYASMARSIRSDHMAGVALPWEGDVGVEGVHGTLPDILASINYHDESMARGFLAMFIQLGQTRTGSRALGQSFIDYFGMSCDAVAGWYREATNEHVVEDLIDWNFGIDENSPLIDWDEDPENTLAVQDLVKLIETGAVIVDDDLRAYISDRWGVVDPGDGTPTPPGPSTITTMVPAANPNETLPEPAPATPAPSLDVVPAAAASSQTLHDQRIGHREPTRVELAARADFSKLQQTWQDRTDKLVQSFQGQVRGKQIDELITQVEAAASAGNIDALAAVRATTTGADVIGPAMLQMMEDAVVEAKAEAAAQGVVMGTIDTSGLGRTLLNQANAIGQLISSSLSNSAATQGMQRYGVSSLSATDVASGVRDHLTSLSDSYLNDMLGGAMTSAQNQGRMLTMQEAPGSFYSSELLDENTCDACSEEDGTEFPSIDDALNDYPTGGFSECEGGARCRGTIVAVYDEASSQ